MVLANTALFAGQPPGTEEGHFPIMALKLEQFLALHRVGQPAIHPDGKSAVLCLARLNSGGDKRISELWSVALDRDETAKLLVSGEHSCHSPCFSEEGSLYFLSKENTENDSENEIDQVWRLEEDGKSTALTDEALGVLDFRIAGDTVLVLAPVLLGADPQSNVREQWREQEKNGPTGRLYSDMSVRSWDHWTGGPAPHFIHYDRRGDNRRDLTPDFDKELRVEHGLPWDLSCEGDRLAAACLRPGLDRLEDSSIVLIEVASGEHRHLGLEERTTHQSLRFSPDGSRVAAARHVRKHGQHGATRLVSYPSAGGAASSIADGWDAQPTITDWHGEEALLVTAPKDGHVPLFRVSVGSGEVSRITSEQAGGSHSDVSCHGDLAYGLRHRFSHPPELFEVVLKEDQTPQLRSSLSGLPEQCDLSVESLRCSGDGGTQVQYFFLSSPLGKEKTKGTILGIHGGPVSAWGDGWHWRWNPLPLLAAGYHVALPNPRGSCGFGQDFIEGVTGNEWGAAAYRDLMAVTDALCQRSDVEANKLVAMGGSFGGYMCNWIGTQSERFAAIITHASLYRLSAFHGTTDYPAYWAHDMGLDPSKEEAALDKFSPHRFVDNWKSPVLIIHGERDYRVPISEALMLFEDLRRRDIDAKLLVFPDENHWILKPRNAEQWYRQSLLFLDARL